MTTILLVFGNRCLGRAIKNGKEDVYCSYENHQYYKEQIHGCMYCDRCWSGDEPVLQGADYGIGLHGATKCPRCQSCSEGTYNPDGDRHWECLPCTVCSDSGMYEAQACTTTQDTICTSVVTERALDMINMVSPSPNPQEMFQAQKDEGKDLHNENGTNILYASLLIVVIVVVMGIIIMYIQRRRQLRNSYAIQNDGGNRTLRTITVEQNYPEQHQTDSDSEESRLLGTVAVEQEQQQVDSSSDSDKEGVSDDTEDYVGSLQDIDNNERAPLVPRRQRMKSCGDYQSISSQYDNKAGRDGGAVSRRMTQRLQRQVSHPVTVTEVGLTERQLDNKRPKLKCVQFLAKLLAPNENYKKFAKKMGLEIHNIKLLEEDQEQVPRNAEDVSYEFISKCLQCQPKLSYHDIYSALTSLELHEELEILKEKRRRDRV
ncbi:uncharacterized protein LOC132547284 [Ylistrum balloti]|uniref:uncharacterized protein LOC132547284 n=1 Tax=Ylistrum balloti TaxID=509963 RepID=UPI002905CD02|nr:uncharacterized protein LOC132547284 [Ylistrum balloti]